MEKLEIELQKKQIECMQMELLETRQKVQKYQCMREELEMQLQMLAEKMCELERQLERKEKENHELHEENQRLKMKSDTGIPVQDENVAKLKNVTDDLMKMIEANRRCEMKITDQTKIIEMQQCQINELERSIAMLSGEKRKLEAKFNEMKISGDKKEKKEDDGYGKGEYIVLVKKNEELTALMKTYEEENAALRKRNEILQDALNKM